MSTRASWYGGISWENPRTGEAMCSHAFYKKHKKKVLASIQKCRDTVAYVRNPQHKADMTREMANVFWGKNVMRIQRNEQFSPESVRAIIKQANAEQKAFIYAYNLDVEGLKRQIHKINGLYMEHMDIVSSISDKTHPYFEGVLDADYVLDEGIQQVNEQDYIDVCEMWKIQSENWTYCLEVTEALLEDKHLL
mgnify:FL=1